MKKILIIIIFLLLSIKTFAKGSFEFLLNIPLGASFGIFNGIEESMGSEPKIKSEAGFDTGITAQIGYIFVFDNFVFSLLGELGYSYDSFKYSSSYNVSALGGSEEFESYDSMYLHSIQVGIIPKFNFGRFAVGLGGGIKIPISGIYESKNIKTINIFGETIKTETYLKKEYKASDYSSYIMPYFKLIFDYSIFFTEKLAFNLGAYFGYDIGINYKTSNVKRIDSFDIGLQLGLRFVPKL